MEISVPGLAPPGPYGFTAGDGKRDVFTEARRAFWSLSEGATASSNPAHLPSPSRSLLSQLVAEEYGAGGGERRRGQHALATEQDVVVARLRNRLRRGRTPGPEECVRLVTGGDGARGAVFEAWPEVVRLHGGARTTRSLRFGLRTAQAPETTVGRPAAG